jgi:RNA polymerase sigma-70 factor, ECF subfamily
MKYRPLAEASEPELIELAQQRHEEAFAELMYRNTSASLRLAISVLKDRQEAEDELQNSFLKAWLHLPKFQFGSSFSTWLRTIVMNQSLMSLRKGRRARLQSLDEPGEDGQMLEVPAPEPSPECLLDRQQTNHNLSVEVRRLPPLLRDVLVLRDLEQLSTEEAATRLGISEPAVKSRLTRARDMLRQRMERHASRSATTLL